MRDCSRTTHPHKKEYFWYALPELSFYSLLTQTHLIMCSHCVSRFHPRKKQNIVVVNRWMKSWRVPSEITVEYNSFPHSPVSFCRQSCPDRIAFLDLSVNCSPSWLALHHRLRTIAMSFPKCSCALSVFWFPPIPKLLSGEVALGPCAIKLFHHSGSLDI